MIDGTQLIKDNQIDLLGAKFQKISKKDKYTQGIPYGMRVSKLVDGKLKRAGIKEGSIITMVRQVYVYFRLLASSEVVLFLFKS